MTIRQPSRSKMVRELAILIPVACLWFFWGTGIGEFISTEGLRALVVKEMKANDNYLVPTVHGRTYLRKPPLYAWTTIALSEAIGRFDEQVARWPSAVMGVLYVLCLYFGGRCLVDPRAGPVAAILGGGNFIVLDHCMRAELDAGVLTLTTLACLLLAAAWMRTGVIRWLAFIGCYLAAIAGSFWKAPNVLLVVWFTVIALALVDMMEQRRDWKRFLFHPMQIVMSLLSIGVLGLWFMALSGSVGAGRTSKFVIWEFLARVVPHSPGHVLEILEATPILFGITIPASIFAIFLFSTGVRIPDKLHRSYQFLMAWLVPNIVFMLFVPAKASRYWFVVFGAIALLGTLAFHLYRSGNTSITLRRAGDWAVRGLLIAAGVSGAVALVAGVLGAILSIQTPYNFPQPWTGAVASVCGVILLLASFCGSRFQASGHWKWVGFSAITILLAFKPLQLSVAMPVRMKEHSVLSIVQHTDQLVPEGEPIYLLSEKPYCDRAGEMADLGYYSTHEILWPECLEDILSKHNDQTFYLLVREEARDRAKAKLGERVHLIEEIVWHGMETSLLKVTPEAPTSAPSQPSN